MWVFENIMADVQVDSAQHSRFLENLQPASSRYLLMFTARSGSSWLGDMLDKNGLGHPEEYINPEFLPETAKWTNSTTRDGIIRALLRVCAHEDVFGIEATSGQIDVFGEEVFFEELNPTSIFFLYRDNIVLQAISLYRAASTGYFHSVQGSKPPLPEYDLTKLSYWLRHLSNQENDTVDLIARRRLRTFYLTYEYLVRDPAGVVDRINRHIANVTGNCNVDTEYFKLQDEWTSQVDFRFRKDASDLISELQSRRKVLTYPLNPL